MEERDQRMQEPATVDSYKENVFQTQQGSRTYALTVFV